MELSDSVAGAQSDVSAFNAACVSVSVSANRDDGEMQKTGKQVSALKLLAAVSCHVIYLEVPQSFYFIEMTVILDKPHLRYN